ncbi:5'-3' exoribonuclease 1-like isoform X2 [Engraulis encrasicolus]|uniref:5'-3' exoribonuclease 1-like isoform X2 n=1 Tax=Engraulis encrasicolus TaxID=184585 RepID=UPI002FCFC8DC
MGVPKFYRWISERYPCLSQAVKEHQIPEFDNLYLDMNGIIHHCSHPNDEDVHFRITQEKIFRDISHYIEVLFRIIKPRKVFFMAVDGVAPRAKMNQQRGRRFKTAKEAEDKIKKAMEKGEVLPKEARFDSNCITPGTDFMAKLQEQLKYFVHSKLSTDRLWQGVKVYLSGHETPGEGEHKIMEFIRSETSKPGHDPNTRHCLYGLDADLIMLGLTTHEPHFSLLREEVRFGTRKDQKRITTPEETTFHLLHLSLLREYIDYEFADLKQEVPFEYDLERIIDDWVLMGFLVGNDFVPHLPYLHIHQDALSHLYRTYISVMPTLQGYLNENGYLNLDNLEKYLEKLSEFDREHFSEVFDDLKWFRSKMGNKCLEETAHQASEVSNSKKPVKKRKCQEDSQCLTTIDKEKDGGGGQNKATECGKGGEEEEIFEEEFRQYKRVYYMSKMGIEVVSEEFLASQAKCYVEAIQWVLHYYYHGVQSWSWYYPHHYAPFLSDVTNISDLKFTFDLAKPFMPFEQLLGVLPSASKDLLPKCYQHLMTSRSSPIIHYYPEEFNTDINGKQQDWEAVVLIPFIDERLLLAAMKPHNGQLTRAEKARNRHTECALYTFDRDLDYSFESPLPGVFPCVAHCHVKVTSVPMDAWRVALSRETHGADRGALYFCGFPTLKHIPHKFYKKRSGVVVFQYQSRGDNMILDILDNQDGDPVCDDVAVELLGKAVFVNWPHLEEARVVAVSDGESKFFLEEPQGVSKLYLEKPPPVRVLYLNEKEQKDWEKEVQGLTEQFEKSKGVIINETVLVLYTQLQVGRKYTPTPEGKVHLEKQWAKQILPHAYQTVVKDIKAFDSSSSTTRFRTLEELYPPGITVFMVGNPFYGTMGEVQDSSDVITEGRVRVVFSTPCEPQLDALIRNQHRYSVKYSPAYILATRLGITPHAVSRFSGSIYLGRGSKKNPHEKYANVGLNLKFNKKNEEVQGYTKKTEKEWLYSAAVEELLAEYIERFSEVFDYVSNNSNEDIFYEDDIWSGEDGNGAEKVQEITSWLKTLPVSTTSRTSCDLQILDTGIVEKLEEELEKAKVKRSNKKVRVTVKPHLLYRPLEQQHGVVPDPDAQYWLLDRVVNVREGFSVPLGLRGTVIGIRGAEREAEVLYDVMFDEEFTGGLTIRCSGGRVYRLPASALINVSHGARLEQQGSHKPTAAVKPSPLSASLSSRPRRKILQITGLPHPPRSTLVPTQLLKGKGSNLKADPRVNRHLPLKALNQRNQQKVKVTGKAEDYSSVWQSLQGSAGPGKPPAHSHKNNSRGGIRLLKRSEDLSSASAQEQPNMTSSEFEDIIANLKITKGYDVVPPCPSKEEGQSGEPLSPLKGTLILKEILKIDDSPGPASTDTPPSTTQPITRQQKRRKRTTKKLAVNFTNAPQPAPESTGCPGSPRPPGPTALLPSPEAAAELGRLCMSCGMGPPEFTYLRTAQGLVVCQVRLSTGLLVHGPHCQSEDVAKEKAAFIALQRLQKLSVASGFPRPPAMLSGVPPLRPTPPQPTMHAQQRPALLMPPQAYGSPAPARPWVRPTLPPHPHQGQQPFYRGAFPVGRGRARVPPPPPLPAMAIGTRNTFVPRQLRQLT